MGSDAPNKQEINTDVFRKVDKIVCDSRDQCFEFGELHHALSAGVIKIRNEVIELGEIISGKNKGRINDNDITICDLTGVGVQDTKIALLAYQRSKVRGLGMRVLKNKLCEKKLLIWPPYMADLNEFLAK